MLAGLIGWTHQPILATWLLPAFFSILSFIAGFAAFRAVLKPDPAKWAAILWAFGFWPLFSGRFCHQGEFIPFWLMVAVLLISRLREAPRDALRLRSAGAGLWIGLGTLTFTAWLAAVPFLYLTSWELLRRRSKKKHLGWGSLTAGLLAGLTPFLVAAHHEGYGQHLLDISPLGNWTDPIRRGLVGASYVTSLLWGSLVEKGSYSSPLGGFLNPLLGGAFLVGLALLLRGIRRPRNAWLLAALPFFLAPGLLARDYIESFRIILVQPLLVAVATYGILRGSLGVQKRGRLLAVAALLTVSSVWDVGTFLSLRNPGTLSPARADSNQFGAALIRNKARSDGPGLLFTDFLTLRHNHSLSVLAYPDNAALRADLDPNHATWAAILAEPGYFGFLERDFPEGQWTSMPPRGGDPGLSLGLVPITPANRARLEGWVSAHHFFHRQNWLAENAQGFRTRYPALVSDLESGRPLMEGDPFLLSAYGEWAAQYYWDPKEARNIGFLRLAIRKGYPAPHLIRKLVDLLREQGDRKEADRIQKAYFPNEPIR